MLLLYGATDKITILDFSILKSHSHFLFSKIFLKFIFFKSPSIEPYQNDLICTTALLPEPPPRSVEWWYYMFDHGQHISFYTKRSLETIARKFGLHLATDGEMLHVFSKKPLSAAKFRRLNTYSWTKWISVTRRRPSRTQSDHERLQKSPEGNP